jgi:hypothetical protein
MLILQDASQHILCDFRVGKFVLVFHAQACASHQACLTEQHEMLGDVRLALARLKHQVADAGGSPRQNLQDLQAYRVQHGLLVTTVTDGGSRSSGSSCYPAPGTEAPESHFASVSRAGSSRVLASTPSMTSPGISSSGM